LERGPQSALYGVGGYRPRHMKGFLAALFACVPAAGQQNLSRDQQLRRLDVKSSFGALSFRDTGTQGLKLCVQSTGFPKLAILVWWGGRFFLFFLGGRVVFGQPRCS